MTSPIMGVPLLEVQHVKPVRPPASRGLVRQVYQQSGRDFGMLPPPVALHSPAPDVLAACWSMLRETLVADGGASRAAKEAVAGAVSRSNECPYCVAVHGAALAAVAAPADAGATDALTAWTLAGTRRATAGSVAAPFPAEQTVELAGVAMVFQYINRMVTVFLGDSPLPPWMPAPGRRTGLWIIGAAVRRSLRRARARGAALDLLPAAPLPPDLAWAAGDPSVADAFARAARAIEDAGERSVPDDVRALVTARLDTWDGEPPGLDRAWLDDALAALAGGAGTPDVAVARLALLAAFAPYRVDDAVIAEVRATGAGDRELIEIVSWASLAAARRIASWSAEPPAA